MTPYSPEALGRVVEKRRREKSFTQEQLGERAGYKGGPGAGVSISRLENGHLSPTPERFEGIAKALGLSADALTQLAEEKTNRSECAPPDDRVSIKDRHARVEREIEGRKQLVTELGRAFDDANDSANNDFLMKLIEIAARVDGAPKPDPAQLLRDDIPNGDDVEAEAAYCIQFTNFGVAQALAGTAVGVAAAATYPTFTADVARWTASAITAIPGPMAVAVTDGFLTALRVGTARRTGSAGRTALLAGIVTTAGVLLWTTQRSRKEQRELTAKLDEAEAEIAETRPNVEALRELMPKATEILEYIAVHAGHALNRWATKLGQEPRDWDSLSADEQQRYQDFVEIAAVQLAVANIDFESLMTNRGGEQERATAVARDIVTQSRKVITSHV